MEKLRDRHSEVIFIPEPATFVINSEQLRESQEQGYQGTFPWNNYAGFGPKVILQSLELEATIPLDADLVVLDRSLVFII